MGEPNPDSASEPTHALKFHVSVLSSYVSGLLAGGREKAKWRPMVNRIESSLSMRGGRVIRLQKSGYNDLSLDESERPAPEHQAFCNPVFTESFARSAANVLASARSLLWARFEKELKRKAGRHRFQG